MKKYKVYAPCAHSKEFARIRSYANAGSAWRRICEIKANGHAAVLVCGFRLMTFGVHRPILPG